MAATRRKGLASSRRRQHDEGEEEDGGLDVTSDSQSETSILSDGNEAYNSDVSDVEDQEVPNSIKEDFSEDKNAAHDKITEGTAEVVEPSASRGQAAGQPPSFEATAETMAMMHGLKVQDDVQNQDVIDFEDSAQLTGNTTGKTPEIAAAGPQAVNRRETLAQRRAREHEEYKTKRENDPAFVPTRGGFFMHDQRNNALGMNQHGQLGRGRGRGGPGGLLGPGRPVAANVQATPEKWSHDLHETVAGPRTVEPRPAVAAPVTRQTATTQVNFPSKTVAIGTVVLKISLPLATTSGKTVKLTVRQHTRLPDLRPPLRRDKPVRIFLPGLNARYIFPSIERSFIFIPRTQRPSQQLGRPQSRLYDQPGSRRQSMFGGSTYAASAVSRRSSVLQQAPQKKEAIQDAARPVVNLPSGEHGEAMTLGMVNGSAVELASTQDHPPPAQPLRQEARRQSLPMHQPRPQKAVSVATIDSPSSMKPPQPQDQAPFHQQMPASMNGPNAGTTERHQSFQGQLPAMTPLSSIPEVAINAQPFQPTVTTGQPTFYPPQYSVPQMFYYPDGTQQQYPSIAYVQQGGFYVPIAQSSGQPPPEASATSPTYAHESNGMVYYYPNQFMGGPAEGQAYDMPPPPQAQNGYYYPQDNGMMYYPTQ